MRIFVSVLFKKYIKALLFTTNLLKFLHIRGTIYMIVLFLLIILIILYSSFGNFINSIGGNGYGSY